MKHESTNVPLEPEHDNEREAELEPGPEPYQVWDDRLVYEHSLFAQAADAIDQPHAARGHAGAGALRCLEPEQQR